MSTRQPKRSQDRQLDKLRPERRQRMVQSVNVTVNGIAIDGGGEYVYGYPGRWILATPRPPILYPAYRADHRGPDASMPIATCPTCFWASISRTATRAAFSRTPTPRICSPKTSFPCRASARLVTISWNITACTTIPMECILSHNGTWFNDPLQSYLRKPSSDNGFCAKS